MLICFVTIVAASCAPAHRSSLPYRGGNAATPLPPRLPWSKPPLAPAEGAALALAVTASHSAFTPARPTIQLKVDYAAARAATDRPPLDIALVLDRSGSMAEDRKLAFAVDAARAVVANLTANDVLSIVTFDEEVSVVAPAQYVTDKQSFLHALDEVHADGRTDISAALLEGIAQLERPLSPPRAPERIRHVLLLTDGMANEGVTAPEALARIAEQAKARGIGVSTLGCGAEFDEQVLAQIAAAGGGRYKYVAKPEEIPQAFRDELHGLLAVVAQNVRLRIEVSNGSVTKTYEHLPHEAAGGFMLPIGNLRSEERGTVLVDITAASAASGGAVDVNVELEFDDPSTAERKRLAQPLRAVITTPDDPIATAEDQGVVVYAGLLAAVERAEEAAAGRDRARHRDAIAKFATWHSRALAYARETGDQVLFDYAYMLEHFMAELDELARDGALHDHPEAASMVGKTGHYERYMLLHHRTEHSADH